MLRTYVPTHTEHATNDAADRRRKMHQTLGNIWTAVKQFLSEENASSHTATNIACCKEDSAP
jgi:hypothetical protein